MTLKTIIPCAPGVRSPAAAFAGRDASPRRPFHGALGERALPIHSFQLIHGRNPSRQRNLASHGADLYHYVDHDVVDWSAVPVHHFRDPRVVAVGGPTIPYEDDHSPGAVERGIYAAMSSGLVTGPSAARYAPIGRSPRDCTESHLMSSNLVIRATALHGVGGWNELLFPNEECELLEKLRSRGRLIYDPGFIARKMPLQTWRELAASCLKYGRGRAAQARIEVGTPRRGVLPSTSRRKVLVGLLAPFAAALLAPIHAVEFLCGYGPRAGACACLAAQIIPWAYAAGIINQVGTPGPGVRPTDRGDRSPYLRGFLSDLFTILIVWAVTLGLWYSVGTYGMRLAVHLTHPM